MHFSIDINDDCETFVNNPTVALQFCFTAIRQQISNGQWKGTVSLNGELAATWQRGNWPGDLYAISATYERKSPGGWVSAVQIPTFLLNANVQGITSEKRAKQIAEDILSSGGDGTTFHVTAVKL